MYDSGRSEGAASPDEHTGDDAEFEVSTLRPDGEVAAPGMSSGASPWLRTPLSRGARLRRLAVTSVVVALALGIVGMQVLPSLRSAIGGDTAMSQPRGTPTATTDTSLALVGTSTLAPAPTNCPAGQAPQRIAPGDFGPVIGESPVWVGPFDGPPTTLRVRSYEVRLEPTAHGWPRPMFVVTMPPFDEPVTIRGMRLGAGTPLWLSDSTQGDATTSVVIHPPAVGLSDDGQQPRWMLWGITVYIPEAGCYMLDARWRGGEWQVPFAAGN